MIAIGLLRHGTTEWNKQGRIQGHQDTGLTEEGRKAFEKVSPPAMLKDAIWYTSPLVRAQQTAKALGINAPKIEPRLVEMDWGVWQGRTLDSLRQEDPQGLALNEAQGLQFRPPGGESPMEVQGRFLDWTRSLEDNRIHAAITHKGVIRAALAMAMEWDMKSKEPQKIDWNCAHVIMIDHKEGKMYLEHLNVPYAPRVDASRDDA